MVFFSGQHFILFYFLTHIISPITFLPSKPPTYHFLLCFKFVAYFSLIFVACMSAISACMRVPKYNLISLFLSVFHYQAEFEK